MGTRVLILFIFIFFSHSQAFTQEFGYLDEISPSFDCEKATTDIEHQICDDRITSALDVVLSTYYKAALKTEFSDNVRHTQQQWLRGRSKCAEQEALSDFHTALSVCYANRLKELKLDYGIEVSPEIYDEIASGLGISTLNTNASDGERAVYYGNFNSYLYALEESECPFAYDIIRSETDYVLITKRYTAGVCLQLFFPSEISTKFCKSDDGHFIEGDIWDCHDKENHLGILEDQIAGHSYSEFAIDKEPYQPTGWPRWNPITNETVDITVSSNLLIKFLYSKPIHSMASKAMFSDRFLEMYHDNRTLLHSLVDYKKSDYTQIILGMNCTYKMIYSDRHWQDIFAKEFSQRSEYGYLFHGCDEYDQPIEGEVYTQKQLYVLFWKLIYDNDATEMAKRLLDIEISMLNTKAD